MFNTYYALAVSAVTAISVSSLAHPQGKINMVRRGLSLGEHLGLAGWTHLHASCPCHWVTESYLQCHGASEHRGRALAYQNGNYSVETMK